MTTRIEVYKVHGERPYVGACPDCRAAPGSLWVISEAGPILSGARFEACEACAPGLAQTVIHTVALLSAGATVNPNAHGE